MFVQHACVLNHFSCVQFFMTLWTIAHQAPLSMGFSRREQWSGLPFPTPGDLPDPGIEPVSLMSPALAGGLFTTSATWVISQYFTGLENKVHFNIFYISNPRLLQKHNKAFKKTVKRTTHADQ